MKKYSVGYYCKNIDELYVINKDSNREILIELRKAYPQGLTAQELARKTRRSVKTMHAQLNELLRQNFVEIQDKTKRPRKRSEDIGRADRFIIEDTVPIINYPDRDYPLSAGSTDQPGGFSRAFHIILDEDKALDDLYRNNISSLVNFTDKVLAGAMSSNDKLVRNWIPHAKVDYCCSGCGINHETRDFLRATLLHLLEHLELNENYVELLKRRESVTPDEYESLLKMCKEIDSVSNNEETEEFGLDDTDYDF